MIFGLAGLPPQKHKTIKAKMSDHGLIMDRDQSGRPMVNVPRVVVDDDPSGFDFGSRRSRDRELALNAMHAALKAAGYKGPLCRCKGLAFFAAYKYARQFGERFIFNARVAGEVVPWEDIQAWLEKTGLVKPADATEAAREVG